MKEHYVVNNDIVIKRWRARDHSVCTSHHFPTDLSVHLAGGYLLFVTINNKWHTHVSMDCFSSDAERVKMIKLFNWE